MSRDIIDQKLLIGKDSNQVIQLIGNPNRKRHDVSQWEYDMGSGVSGFGIMIYYLHLKFENKKVESAEQITYQD